MSEIENGHVEPSPEEAQRIARALGVSIESLVNDGSSAEHHPDAGGTHEAMIDVNHAAELLRGAVNRGGA